MLPKQQRLSNEEVRRVRNTGASVRSNTATIQFISAETNKCAVVVPKKGNITAVVRNDIRRRVYDVCAEQAFICARRVHVVVFLYIKKKEEFSIEDVCAAIQKAQEKLEKG